MSISNVELVPVLQTAIGPVILISGIGLLLLTMTNRLGRAIDRARSLSSLASTEGKRITDEVKILWRRSQLLRRAILLASTSVLLTALLIITLFVSVLLKIELALLISAIFIFSMCAIIGSLIYFLRDINLALEALKLEMHPLK